MRYTCPSDVFHVINELSNPFQNKLWGLKNRTQHFGDETLAEFRWLRWNANFARLYEGQCSSFNSTYFAHADRTNMQKNKADHALLILTVNNKKSQGLNDDAKKASLRTWATRPTTLFIEARVYWMRYIQSETKQRALWAFAFFLSSNDGQHLCKTHGSKIPGVSSKPADPPGRSEPARCFIIAAATPTSAVKKKWSPSSSLNTSTTPTLSYGLRSRKVDEKSATAPQPPQFIVFLNVIANCLPMNAVECRV